MKVPIHQNGVGCNYDLSPVLSPSYVGVIDGAGVAIDARRLASRWLGDRTQGSGREPAHR